MDQIKIKPSASHPTTNEVIFKLITGRIDKNCKILDFGAGRGYMAQRIGDHLEDADLKPEDHLFACEVAPEHFQYNSIKCHKILPDSIIPFDDNTFDVIYAIEVIEHTQGHMTFCVRPTRNLKKAGA